MAVILKSNHEEGKTNVEVFETSTFKMIYNHVEQTKGEYFLNEIVHFSMLYKTLQFAIVFKNRPMQ